MTRHNRIRHLCGLGTGKSNKGRQKAHLATTRRAPTLEPLEERRLLAANLLASLDGDFVSTDGPNQALLTVTGGESALISLHASRASGTFDPDHLQIESISGHTIAPVGSIGDMDGSTDSLWVGELGPGTYRIFVSGEGSTWGKFQLDVSLLGDVDGDGTVGTDDLTWTQAAMSVSSGTMNAFTASYYESLGIDVSSEMYEAGTDADGDGEIDYYDFSMVQSNLGSTVGIFELDQDNNGPAIEAALEEGTDTGVSDSDGISSELTIVGTVTDEHEVVEFRLGMDDMAEGDYLSILADVDETDGSFSFSADDLHNLTGIDPTNTDGHTLHLIAVDDFGNESVYSMTFEHDTLPPTTIGNPDLVDASDWGTNNDDLTADTTPTISVEVEPGDIVYLYDSTSTLVAEAVAGDEGIANLEIEEALADGTYTFTAKVVDVAGNEGQGSTTPLEITIDTVVEISEFDLDQASDSGEDGDQLTTMDTVTFVGVATPGAVVSLDGMDDTADGSGNFSFAYLNLPFGETEITVTATTDSGATVDYFKTFTRNNAPMIGTPIDRFYLEVDQVIDPIDLSDLFDDANLADGDTLTLEIVPGSVSNPNLLVLPDTALSGFILSPQLGFGQSGFSTATIRATDMYGESAEATLTFNVDAVNDPPVLEGGKSFEVTEGGLHSEAAGWLLEGATDEDGDTLTVMPLTLTTGLGAAVTVNADGSFSYDLTGVDLIGLVEGETETDQFMYMVDDGINVPLGGIVTITINGINDAPTAEDFTVEVLNNGSTSINVLEHASDIDGDTLSIHTFTQGSEGGTLTEVDGKLEYTPVSLLHNIGEETFTFSVDDPNGAVSPTVTVTVQVVTNISPVAGEDKGDSTYQNSVLNGTGLLENDTDADGDDDALVVTAETVNLTSGATVTISADGSYSYDPNGAFDYLPVGESVDDMFEYTVTDENGGTDTGTVTVTVIGLNDPPVAGNDTATTDQDTVLNGTGLLDNDTDPDDNDTLEVSAGTMNLASGATVTISTDGSYSYDPNGAFDYLGVGESVDDTFDYTVSDGNGLIDTATVTIAVTGLNDAPVAGADTGSTGQNSVLNGTGLLGNDTDPDDSDTLTVIAETLTTGQGAIVTINDDGSYSYDPNGQFDYLGDSEEATDTFEYTVSDGNGETDTGTVTITVTGVNDAPVAGADTGSTDQDSVLDDGTDLQGNDTDPDGDTLTVTAETLTTGQGAIVTINADGSYSYDPNGLFDYLAWGESATDTFEYTVSDGNGETDTATVTVTVTGINDSPVPSAKDFAVDAGGSFNGPVGWLLVGATDAEGDPLTVIEVPTTSLLGAVVTINADGSFSYDLAGVDLSSLGHSDKLTDTFPYVVDDGTDAAPGSAIVTVTIHGLNDEPVAVNDDDTTDQNTVLNGTGLLDNDTDPDGDTLTVIAGTLDLTSGATVTISADGSYTYDPNGAFDYLGVGESFDDTFEYTVSDGNGGSDTATVTITVTGLNDPPVALAKDFAVDAGGSFNGPVGWLLVGATDAEGDSLTVVEVPITSLLGAAVTINADGSFSYDLAGIDLSSLGQGETATDSFPYVVEDGNDGISFETVTITINGVNDEPVASDDTVSTDKNTVASGNVLDNDSDPDSSDTLTVTAETLTTGQGAAVTINADGSYSYDPNGQFDYLLPGESATDTFEYAISDGNGGSDTATVTVTVAGSNDAPVAVGDTGSTDQDSVLNGTGLLDNDTDADGDTLAVVGETLTTAGGATVTINADGSYSYDPNGAFDYLGVGESVEDTFEYTVSDGKGGTDTATVTITVTGLNDTPVAGDDAGSTDKDTVLNGTGLLGNDTDVDTSNILTVTGETLTTGQGAAVTINADGSFSYDPNGQFDSLAEGESATDTFIYTVSDGNGGTDTATVTITVTGVTDVDDPPALDSPIADLNLTDGDTQIYTYDLSTVFSDDGALQYSVTSSNTDLVTAQILPGTSTLQVTYEDYASGQDRTPADIVVTATEVGGMARSVQDSFTVTVDPITTVDVVAVVREIASEFDTLASLPGSITEVTVGTSYVVEFWVIDHYTGTTGTGPVNDGLGGATIDVAYDNLLSSTDNSGLHKDGPLSTLLRSGSVDQASGMINNLGGVVDLEIYSDIGLGEYVRLGYVEFDATAVGSQDIDVEVNLLTRDGIGILDSTQLNVTDVSVDIVAASNQYTFDLSSTNVQISGNINGQAIAESEPGSGYNSPTGSCEVILDDPSAPSSFQIVSGSIDMTTFPGWPLPPDENGQAGSAAADFGLSADLANDITMAIRDMVVGLSSSSTDIAWSSATNTGTFSLDNVISTITSGDLDTLVDASPDRSYSFDLEGETLEQTGSESGTILITPAGDKIEIAFNTTRRLDLSTISAEFQTGSYLDVAISFEAEYDIPGAPLHGTEVAASEAVAGEVYTSLVTEKTLTDATGQRADLPMSETWVDEWDSYWVEVWAKADEADGLSLADVDLVYNGDYFTAVEIEHGAAFDGELTGDISVDGLVSSLGGQTSLEGVGGDGYLLLGRVKFESLADDNVAVDFESNNIGPNDLGLALTVNSIDWSGTELADTAVAAMPGTDVWAVPMDANDDGSIDINDVLQLIGTYQVDTLAEVDNAMAAVMDFDHSGIVDINDLLVMIGNYNIDKADGIDLALPENFTQTWVGSDITGEGTYAVDELFESALDSWASSLGIDPSEMPEYQLVVDDLDGSQLGEGQILEVDEAGVPSVGRITIDDDAAGLGWYSDLETPTSDAQYDLYTVMLHEIGHTLGFVGGYDGFDAYVENEDGQTLFVGTGFEVQLDAGANHIADPALADDLMASTLTPGERKEISSLDVAMVELAQEAATSSTVGSASLLAPMTAATQSEPVLTSDFNQIEGDLEGDVTWANLFKAKEAQDREEAESLADAVMIEQQLVDETVSIDGDSEEGDQFEWVAGMELSLSMDTEDDSRDDDGLLDSFDTVFDNWNG
jgi:VCBS repeat-containing protein